MTDGLSVQSAEERVCLLEPHVEGQLRHTEQLRRPQTDYMVVKSTGTSMFHHLLSESLFESHSYSFAIHS